MLDILVTIGVILVLIALAALLLHLINTHHARDMATAHYEPFHPGDPPRARQDRGEDADRAEREQDGERRDEGGGAEPPRSS